MYETDDTLSPSVMLTPREAASRLNCSADTVKRLCCCGALRCENIGTQSRKVWRVYEDSLVGIRKPAPLLERDVLSKYLKRRTRDYLQEK